MNAATASLVLRLLDLVIAGIVIAPAGLSKVRELVREGRDPTPAEWQELDAALERARRDLHTDGPAGTYQGTPV